MIYEDILNLPIAEIVDKLNRGQVMVYSTDTVMGLGCIGTHEGPVRKLFEIKDRQSNKPISYAFSSVTQIEAYVDIPSNARPLLSLFPGPITLVLPIKSDSRRLFGIDQHSIGVRIPKVKWLLDLLIQLNQPLVTTSANISGQPSPISLSEVNQQVLDAVEIIVSLGTCSGESSTVVSCLNNDIVILREGAVSKVEIDKLIAS